ncbi:tRNA 2-selenouridine(34) synthase MnmH [Virgibacillus sp. SK37]|uniref:tRNA 2-selenouridine(34) synthase MnmH n=1 Tax=Virgibacillus sp. SK37 TaxID=403957 RepID=UPI0004D1E2BF|nr:tRNA 2-selenouridine(34) synthase MnmH [Virgibacillus sp. SK37]AIF44856.1 tRNA 2-selenouridine synthase [Virgibacillus sp. SK37]
MFKDIELNELLQLKDTGEHTLIDVRSPKEFNEATIPGSINIPIFTNEERAEVGTLYKQVGQDAAKKRGLEIFSAKLPEFIHEFGKIQTSMTVFCWRGGMRSKTAATVLDLMGIKATRLSGGIRTYRKWVISTLEQGDFKPDLIVLNGYTGSGKTVILHELAKKGYPIINLEGMANHRGSIFGQIGLHPNNQKKFEALLVQKMIEFQQEPFVFIEGESKRIGKVSLPDFLYSKKEKSMQLFIHIPMEERVKHILEDYQPWENPDRFREAFQIIKKRIHTPIAKEIEQALEAANYHYVAELLLNYYYDPRYEHAANHYPEQNVVDIHAADVTEAVQKIEELIQQHTKQNIV